MRFRLLFTLLLFLVPLGAYAGAFHVDETDKSMQYLAGIFGTMGSLPIQGSSFTGTNIIFPTLVDKFNVIIFTLGIIIIAWTTLVSTISTAQEGEVLGKKFSSIWIPARVGFGMYLLLPSGTSGYSLLQLAVMWMIVQGVGAANSIWKEIVLDPNSIHSDTRSGDVMAVQERVEQLLRVAMCAEAINSDSTLLAAGQSDAQNQPVQIYRTYDGSEQVINIGLVTYDGSDAAKAKMCGQIRFEQRPPWNEPANQETLVSGGETALLALGNSAYEVMNLAEADWVQYNNLAVAIRSIKSAYTSVNIDQNLDSVKQRAIEEGWIHVGSFYFNIVGGFGGGSGGTLIGDFSVETPNTDAIREVYGSMSTNAIQRISEGYSEYINEANKHFRAQADATANFQSSNSGGLNLNTNYSAGGAQSILNAIFGSLFSNLRNALQEQITQNNSSGNEFRDPVVSMSRFGSEVVSIIEIVFFVGLGLAFLVWLGGGIMCSIQPLCNTLNFVIGIVMSVVGMLISLLYVGSLTMALYIPMIPYLVFTFAALTWIILVIEAILAAPLVGLTLVMPSEDELGKATNGIVILFGLFLRPPLMVLGFLFSVKLLFVAFAMLNFGFNATISIATAENRALFASIAVFTLYVGLCIALVHECFTLIYKVPDQVLRWIGSSSGGGDEMSKVKGVKGSYEKGANVSKGIMAGLNKKAGEKAGAKGGIGV